MRTVLLATLALAAGLASGCNLTKLAANQTVDVMRAGRPSIDREADLGLARANLEANLGLMAGLSETVPDNAALIALRAEALTSYAFGFVEDDLDALGEDDPAREDVIARASALYLRGREEGLRWLEEEGELPDLVEADDATFDRALARAGKEHVAMLFWVGNAWASAINLQQGDPMMILDLPRPEAIMRRLVELDEGYFDGGPHLVLGVMMASTPAALADMTVEAAEHFDRAVALSEGKNLMVRALRARWLHVARRDRAAFVAELNAVLSAPSDLSASRNLVNALARRRAARWLARVDRYFPGG